MTLRARCDRPRCRRWAVRLHLRSRRKPHQILGQRWRRRRRWLLERARLQRRRQGLAVRQARRQAWARPRLLAELPAQQQGLARQQVPARGQRLARVGSGQD